MNVGINMIANMLMMYQFLILSLDYIFLRNRKYSLSLFLFTVLCCVVIQILKDVYQWIDFPLSTFNIQNTGLLYFCVRAEVSSNAAGLQSPKGSVAGERVASTVKAQIFKYMIFFPPKWFFISSLNSRALIYNIWHSLTNKYREISQPTKLSFTS